MEERKEIGVREQFAEDLEAALAAPHPGEPVVNQRDPGRCNHRRKLADRFRPRSLIP
jgi:hypothetical protein